MQYLLVLCSYMEEETYIFDTLSELLSFWHCKSLQELFKRFPSSRIYFVEDEINNDNFDDFLY